MKTADVVWLVEHVDREMDVACSGKAIVISVMILMLLIATSRIGFLKPGICREFMKFHALR